MNCPPEYEPLFSGFEPVLLEDIDKFTSKAPTKTSVLDPVPVDIIKEYNVFPAYCKIIAAECDNAQIPERSRSDTIAQKFESGTHPKKLQTSVNTAICIQSNRKMLLRVNLTLTLNIITGTNHFSLSTGKYTVTRLL